MLVLGNLMMLVVFIIAAIAIDTVSPGSLAALGPGYALQIFFWIYYRTVCKSWVALGAMSSDRDASVAQRATELRSEVYRQEPVLQPGRTAPTLAELGG